MDTFLGTIALIGPRIATFAAILINKILFHAQTTQKNINSKRQINRKIKTTLNMIILCLMLFASVIPRDFLFLEKIRCEKKIWWKGNKNIGKDHHWTRKLFSLDQNSALHIFARNVRCTNYRHFCGGAHMPYWTYCAIYDS